MPSPATGFAASSVASPSTLPLPWASLAPPAAEPSVPLLELNLDTQAGHDDDLLADLEGIGVLSPVSASLFSTSPVLRLRRRGVFSERLQDRLDASVEAGLSGYSETAIGPDRDARGEVFYQMNPSPRFLLEGTASVVSFRRRQLPVFDLDQPEVGCEVGRILGRRWLVSGRLDYSRPSYPGRALTGGSHQLDDRFEAGGSLLRSFGSQGYAAILTGWRGVDSNDPYAVESGPLLETRLGQTLPGAVELAASFAFNRRAYPNYPVLSISGGDTTATGATRTDRIWQGELSAERPISGRVRLFASGLFVHEISNVAALGFRQARWTGGVRVRLWRTGSESRRSASSAALPWSSGVHGVSASGDRPDSLAPVTGSGGVRFRVRASGARQVSLVGGFNAWREAKMEGPDAGGSWEITVPVPAGTWRYAFVIDGKWVRPEGAAQYEEDGFGDEIGILEVESGAAPGGRP